MGLLADGPDVGRASAENEAVNSTSLNAVDDLLPLKDSIVTRYVVIRLLFLLF